MDDEKGLGTNNKYGLERVKQLLIEYGLERVRIFENKYGPERVKKKILDTDQKGLGHLK